MRAGEATTIVVLAIIGLYVLDRFEDREFTLLKQAKADSAEAPQQRPRAYREIRSSVPAAPPRSPPADAEENLRPTGNTDARLAGMQKIHQGRHQRTLSQPRTANAIRMMAPHVRPTLEKHEASEWWGR